MAAIHHTTSSIIFFKETIYISITISLTFIPKGPIDSIG